MSKPALYPFHFYLYEPQTAPYTISTSNFTYPFFDIFAETTRWLEVMMLYLNYTWFTRVPCTTQGSLHP